MSSHKSKTFNFGSKRSQSMNTSKPISTSPSDTLKTKRSQFAMLASLPFRYAFSNNSNNWMKQTSLHHPSDTGAYQPSNLIRNSIDESTSEVGISEENLIKQPSFSSSDIDDYKPHVSHYEDSHHEFNVYLPSDDVETELNYVIEEVDNFVEEEEEEETIQNLVENEFETIESRLISSSDINNFTLPNKPADDLLSPFKKTGIRRHHSAPQSEAKWLQAKRKAIVVQMYDTEKSYVEALKILVTKYYLPLKEKDIVERNLINDIFYKIPEIHVHHELLLSSLKSKFDAWDTRQTIGDLLLNTFAKQSVIETYISFVNNYHISQEAIRISKDQSSIFSKFIEQQAKDHRGKLTLKDLIIQPVQRIPRYELYIKDFLKCTPTNHSDYQFLTKASKELHTLAEKIDQVHKELHESYGTDSQSVLQIVQDLIENLDDLVNAYRYYIRHDMITLISPAGVKKERCLFLFSDLIIITSCKRRSGNINKRTNSIILNSPIGKQYLESIKYKFIMKFQLEDIDLTGSHLTKKSSIEKDFLEEDLNTLTRINELAKNIVYPHQNLDESIREISTSIIRQINDTSNLTNSLLSPSSTTANNEQSINSSTNIGLNKNTSDATLPNITENKQLRNRTVLTINTMERVEVMTVIFGHADQRLSWEKCFIEAKKIFFESSSRKPATFLNVIAIPRNRSGVQFTCASARIHLTSNPNDVWICSTDGQMGQVCIMNTFPELTVSSCNTVCNSRISCIQCVPPYRLKRNSGNTKKLFKSQAYGHDETENSNKAEQSNATQSESNDSANYAVNLSSKNQFIQQLTDRLVVNLEAESILNYDSSDDEDDTESHSGNEELSSKDTEPTAKVNENIPIYNQNNATNTASYAQDSKHSTMWIGNDDGSLHIFQFYDSAVRTVSRKNRITKQFSSSIQSLVYMDNKVFVSLKSGELAIFKRTYSVWNYDSYTIKTIVETPFNCMLAVAGKLWCASGNSVFVLNPNHLTIENNFSIENEDKIILATGASSNWAVWVASQRNLDLRLYHATKYTLLAEINIRQCVAQKLAKTEELIRIHKLSCLRITCLYVCKDTLWIGTSAGVICNVKIPHIGNATNKLNSALNLKVLNNGHFGPVRFITSVEIAKNPPQSQNSQASFEHGETSCQYKTVAISGGEGYEEYKNVPVYTSGMSLGSSLGAKDNTINQTNSTLTDVQGQNMASNNNSSNLASNSPGAQIQSQNSSSLNAVSMNSDDYFLGKDDLINYVLTWDI